MNWNLFWGLYILVFSKYLMKYKKILTIILKEFIYIHYYNLIIIQFKNKTGAINITN